MCNFCVVLLLFASRLLGEAVGGHAVLHHVLGGLQKREHIVLERLPFGTEGRGFGGSALGVEAVAVFAVGFGIIYIKVGGIACGYGFVGRVESRRTLFAQQVDAEVVLHVRHAQQAKERGGYVHLSGKIRYFAGRQTFAMNEQRNVVEGFGQFAVGGAHHFAVVAKKDEKRVLVPGFARGLLHETADAVVGVAHNLFFGRERGVGKGVGNDVGRMVADGEQGGHEGMAFGGTLAQHGQGVTEQKGVGYAEMIDDFAARIIFLGIHFVVAVGAEKGVHVVVLAFVGHKEQGAVALLFKHGGKA